MSHNEICFFTKKFVNCASLSTSCSTVYNNCCIHYNEKHLMLPFSAECFALWTRITTHNQK